MSKFAALVLIAANASAHWSDLIETPQNTSSFN